MAGVLVLTQFVLTAEVSALDVSGATERHVQAVATHRQALRVLATLWA
jgi:hypothetical protein